MIFAVTVGYPIRSEQVVIKEVDDRLRSMALFLGGEFSGSGAGFGMRDLSFDFGSEAKANEYFNAVRKSDIKICVLAVGQNSEELV